MREKITAAILAEFMRELAARTRTPGGVYFTGGATALLLGVREQTIDIDIKFDPEPAGAFEAIGELKERLSANVELASPMDFVPVSSDWKLRSVYIQTEGKLAFFHFDLRAQAISKIERGFEHDLLDAREFMKAGGFAGSDLLNYFEQIRPSLLRYPAVDAVQLASKLQSFLKTS